MILEEYVKEVEKENERLQTLIHQTTWFHGTERIIAPYKNNLITHPNWLISAGWFWFKEMKNGHPLMGCIGYNGHKTNPTDRRWYLYDAGQHKHCLETFDTYWFCGPLEPPKDN